MTIETFVKLAYATQAVSALTLVGVGIYATKTQKKLDRSIAEGTAAIVANNETMTRILMNIK
jgi:hypothetical protein